MAIEVLMFIEEQLRRLPKDHPQRSFLEAQKAAFSTFVDNDQVSGESPEVKINLKAEWQRQVDGFIKLGFHKELRLSEKAYTASLPQIESQSEEYKNRFDIPLVVETRIPARKQASLARINDVLGNLEVHDWKDPRGIDLPKAPYSGWFQNGGKYLSVSVQDFRKRLSVDEIAGNPFEAMSLVLAHPEILDHHAIDVPGSSVDSVDALSVRRWVDGVSLYYGWTDYANPDFGSLSRGSKISS